jgi:hypothetical protein
LWRAFFSNRYEKTTNSRSLADFNELKPFVTGAADKSLVSAILDGTKLPPPQADKTLIPAIFDGTKHPLPQIEELVTAGWPVSKERLARAILALALKHGGWDLADGSTASRANVRRREYHHLFPDAHLDRMGISQRKIYLSLNCALVSWQTNRNISAKNPERYLAERREGTSLGEGEIRARLATHLIPFDEMVKNDYQAFLARRSSMVHEAMTKLCAAGGT